MKINSFIFEYYKQQCEPKPVHVPAMPEGNRAVMEAIRDEVVTIATKAQAEGNKALLKALAAVPNEFPELTKEIARIDAEILSVRNDMAKRPKCGPAMGKLVLALLEVLKGNGDEHYTQIAEGKLTALLVGYDTTERLAKLEQERRGLISYAEGLQESLIQAIGRAHAPHLVQAAMTSKLDSIR